MNIIEQIKKFVKNESESTFNVENAVIVTEESVIVTVSVTPPENMDFHGSNYFVKELKKQIPALDNVIIQDRPISVVMKVPITSKSGRANTIQTITDLGCMAMTIIKLLITNYQIPKAITAIGDDCKPWFDDSDRDEEFK